MERIGTATGLSQPNRSVDIRAKPFLEEDSATTGQGVLWFGYAARNGGLELNDSNLKAPTSIFIIDDDGPDIRVSYSVDRTRSENEGIMSEYAPAMG